MTDYGVIIVGGGHAGSDAAAASARMGVKTALITHKFSTIGEMSCNPAIGGLGKGHLVREIDALDGVMARVADKGGIQFKVLNRRKGPAVRGPRAQADRKLYREAMQAELRTTENLDIIEAEVDDLIVENDVVVGVVLLDGTKYFCSSVVLTTGTFLRGLIHLGADSFPAGRHGERPVLGLSTRLENLGLELGRLKTGTPARLDGRTINWDILEKQEGDEEIEPFSSLTDKITNTQITCYETRTNPETHRIIEENLHLSALYGGRIQSRGPRYCPSIEDKVVRFAEKDNHLVFLEPEGLDDDTVYPNGVSSCLPEDIQLAFFRTMKGLENVEFFRPGYAIEYDFVDPRQLTHELMLKKLPGLFLAGQINGTTGYEEAAAQGLFAGANAALRAQGKAPWHLSRTNSYIGVMIDDLIARGVTEPYRMFTSRAEFRLHLRVDNADQRLTDIGAEIGLIGGKRLAYHAERKAKLDAGRLLLKTLNATPNEARKSGLAVNSDGVRRTAFEILSYPTTEKHQLFTMWPVLKDISPEIFEQLTVDAQYAVYLERQQIDVDAVKRDEQRLIPSWLSFDDISGLSNEIRYKLNQAKPQTIAQAQKIEGITPSALMLILAVMRRGTIDKKAS